MKDTNEELPKKADIESMKDGEIYYKGKILPPEEPENVSEENTETDPNDWLYDSRAKHWMESVSRPRPMSWRELNERTFPKDRWRIDNLVPKDGFVIVAGISGEKKTWVALEMAKSIIEGKHFVGEFMAIPGNVLYLDMEMSQSELQRRCRQLQFKEDDLRSIYFLNGDLNLNQKDEEDGNMRWLLNYVKEKNISAIFVDTFRGVAGGMKEEKAEEVRSFFNQFKKLKEDSVSVIFLDHFRKPNNFEGKVPKKEHLFASQDKVASVEVLLMLKSEDNSNLINVYQRKNRIGKELKPFKILMDDEESNDGGKITKLIYGGELEEDEYAKDRAKDKLLEVLRDGGKGTPELIKIMTTEFKIGGKNTRAALRELASEKLIKVAKEGKKNYYELIKDSDNDKPNDLDEPIALFYEL